MLPLNSWKSSISGARSYLFILLVNKFVRERYCRKLTCQRFSINIESDGENKDEEPLRNGATEAVGRGNSEQKR